MSRSLRSTSSSSVASVGEHDYVAPQLIPLKKASRGVSLAAGSTGGQEQFMSQMGIDENLQDDPSLDDPSLDQFMVAVGAISSIIKVPDENLLGTEWADIFSCALGHSKKDVRLSDPYFTDEEWDKVVTVRDNQLLDARTILRQVSTGATVVEESKQWVETNISLANPMCGCITHKDPQLFNYTRNLICISPPLNDDSGYCIASTIIRYILDVVGLGEKFEINAIRQGSEASVNFMLQMPSGATSVFTGHGDFQLSQNYTFAERRLGLAIETEQRLRALGDIQSPPKKKSAFAQAGIYTVGGLAKLKGLAGIRKMATILLYKDLMAHLAIATLDPEKATMETSVGQVTFKVVDSLPGYNLLKAAELNRFATVLVTTLKETLVVPFPT